jgi:hypothetical protein
MTDNHTVVANDASHTHTSSRSRPALGRLGGTQFSGRIPTGSSVNLSSSHIFFSKFSEMRHGFLSPARYPYVHLIIGRLRHALRLRGGGQGKWHWLLFLVF